MIVAFPTCPVPHVPFVKRVRTIRCCAFPPTDGFFVCVTSTQSLHNDYTLANVAGKCISRSALEGTRGMHAHEICLALCGLRQEASREACGEGEGQGKKEPAGLPRATEVSAYGSETFDRLP